MLKLNDKIQIFAALIYRYVDLCVNLCKTAGFEPIDRTFRKLQGAKPEGEKVPTHYQDGQDSEDGYGAAIKVRCFLFFSIL